MLSELPSLRGFQPKFYTGSAGRCYLPLQYDLVAITKPKVIVLLGFGDGQAFFTFCQAVRENEIACRCVAVRRSSATENADDDEVWQKGKADGEEFYGERAEFVAGSSAELAATFPDGSVDVLLIDDCDSYEIMRDEFAAWESKLAADGIALLHGIALERSNGPQHFWSELTARYSSVAFGDGIGLGLIRNKLAAKGGVLFLDRLFDSAEASAELKNLYCLAVDRIDTQARAYRATRKNAALTTRQIWLGSLLEDRWKVQDIMDHQARVISDLEQKIARVDQLTAERNKLKAQLNEHKKILKAAKQLCRKKGRCFQTTNQPDVEEHRSIPIKIARELGRIPRNLRRLWSPVPAPPPPAAPALIPDRYGTWIADHEPNAAALEEQRQRAAADSNGATISLIVPVCNPTAIYLEEMLASVAAQTYPHWELCIVDAGSDHPEVRQILVRWQEREPRIRVERLETNLGISQNSNRALRLASGNFVAFLDHDDLLAPFALYELAQAISQFPQADIFYSDEDRWSEQDGRHLPFFKPEWSPELLLSSMYLGHLIAYRRQLVEELGGFRKEFDLSQDYDLALRATERARKIRHIAKVLYHWREHPESGSTGGKPDARKTNLAALGDAMRRRNLPAEIIEYPTANRARLQVSRWPRVSLIVPTDSPTRAQICGRDLPRSSDYPDLEIVIVTNSKLLESLKSLPPEQAAVRFVVYDEPFNFSAKCNLGAEAATGERLIFFNDDVETQQPDWIQELIEPLENPEVGAVSPKLLYKTGKIQHAGLVMGVRGLAGTAFHQRPGDSTEYFNLAQSLRDVAALSAACLAVRREDFFRLGGFDAVNTPIAHSDIDLCFKIREAWLRCVYTPFATLRHAGHVSIATEEKNKLLGRRDKASIYLLKRWGGYTTRDPYFTENMRDWLCADSPTPIRMTGRNQARAIESSNDLLFVCHDLSLSGAPMMLWHAAVWCHSHGSFVVVMAPEDGPLRAKYEAAGIPLIIDPLILTGHKSFAKFARDFDYVVANTIRSGPVVNALQGENMPVLWWLHEPGSVGEHYLREDASLRAALPLAEVLIAPSERTAAVYQPFTDRPVKCLRNAIPDLEGKRNRSNDDAERPLQFVVLGSVEPRKGQDLFVQAVALLPKEIQGAANFQVAGRVLDPEFGSKIETAGASVKNFSMRGPLSHAEAIALLDASDVLVCPSRDEAMPTVTILEAMSLGKAIISTKIGGAAEFLTDGVDALLVRPENVLAVARAIRRAIGDRALVRKLGNNARITYEKSFTMSRFGAEFQSLLRAATSVEAVECA
ncbi:MAG: glycosyltransferase [Verrucomicrobiota bacterium]